MPIENWDAFREGFWNYQPFNDILPGSIALTDIDGCVERNGNFLFFEFKAPGVKLPTGQRILIERGTRTGTQTWLVIEGKCITRGDNVTIDVTNFILHPPYPVTVTSFVKPGAVQKGWEGVVFTIRRWFDYANAYHWKTNVLRALQKPNMEPCNLLIDVKPLSFGDEKAANNNAWHQCRWERRDYTVMEGPGKVFYVVPSDYVEIYLDKGYGPVKQYNWSG